MNFIISGYISLPVYEVVEAETEEQAFDLFFKATKEEHGEDVDVDYVDIDKE